MEDGFIGTTDEKSSINVLEDMVQSTLAGARQLLAEVESNTSEMAGFDSEAMCHSTVSGWNREIESLESVLAAGRQVGAQKINHMLDGGVADPNSSNERSADEALFPPSEQDQESGTWAMVVSEQNRAVKRLVHAIPHVYS